MVVGGDLIVEVRVGGYRRYGSEGGVFKDNSRIPEDPLCRLFRRVINLEIIMVVIVSEPLVNAHRKDYVLKTKPLSHPVQLKNSSHFKGGSRARMASSHET